MALGVYVHIPYCVKKCPYCDFNSYGVGKRIPEEEYTEAVLKELDFYRGSIEKRPLSSIFFGGGTPSLFSSESIGKIIDKIEGITFPLDSLEVSLEVNPKTADLEKLKSFREVGVNRISVGVQSFSERKLKILGRINLPDDSRRVLEEISRAGFVNFNLDLMYGVSFETLDEWRLDLEKALEFNTNHISAYCLTIEDDTEFGTLYSQNKLPLPDEDLLTDMITFTSEFLERAGYTQYEISNFAKPGFECRHNLLYWRGENYLGLGAGAHSHLPLNDDLSWGMRFSNLKNPALYMKTVKQGKKPLAFTEFLNKQEALEDRVLMGLRLREGINILNLEERFGIRPSTNRLGILINDGFINISDDFLQLSKKGILVSDELILKVLDSFAFE
ncbi:MAG: radical SAM family heme chaperone HemW [Deltaproteobacteria bacterium]|nr:radical SAM family heme chaperone HemW [Deltaproteobacteria bacterium]